MTFLTVSSFTAAENNFHYFKGSEGGSLIAGTLWSATQNSTGAGHRDRLHFLLQAQRIVLSNGASKTTKDKKVNRSHLIFILCVLFQVLLLKETFYERNMGAAIPCIILIC